MKKLWSSNIYFLKFRLFNFSNFQTTFAKIFMKKLPGFKTDFESTNKVLPVHQYLWSEISRQWNNGPLIFFFFFFLICTQERFLSYILSNKGNGKASIWLILLKCTAVGYFNGNESFTGKLFANYYAIPFFAMSHL